MKAKFKHLLSPLQIGPLQIRNRVLVSAHVPGFATDHKPGKRYIAYQKTYAESGVGLQITGGTPIHPSGLLGVSPDSVWNMDDSVVPGYRALGKAIHAEGGRILAQLAHSGGTVLINQPGKESWSASAVRSETTGNISHAMSISEIQQVIDAYGAGAARVDQGDLDGVELLGAFGFLPQAFLSPLTNFRNDHYGGSLENRLRFTLEVLAAVRHVLGSSRILGIRIPGDEMEPGGLTLEDMKVVAKRLADTGLIDYLNVTAHTNFSHTGRGKHWAPTPAPHGLFVHLAAAIRSVVSIPVFAVGRIIDPLHAEKIIATDQADMVGMTRAHICDPQIVAKIKRNAPDEIRPCVGANTCIAHRYDGKPIRCMHNPALANPEAVPAVSEQTKQVTVVGGGPAGLEAARVAAQRGHEVTLYEAQARLGGQLALWASAHSMRELEKIISWRVRELDRLGVTVVTDRAITLDVLSGLPAEEVIVATGSQEYTRPVEGDPKFVITTPHALLRGEIPDAKVAIIYNEGRGQAGLAAAELLLRGGVEVEIVTSDIAVAADLDPTNRNSWYIRLEKYNCSMTASYTVSRAHANTLVLKRVHGGSEQHREGIDLFVDWGGCRVNDTLICGDQEFSFKLHSVGDCVAPRNVEIAMSEAAGIANKI